MDLAGVDVCLVGDSAAMVVHGHDTTLPITLEEMLSHFRAVARGASRPLLIGDLPFGSYERDPAQAIETATRIMKEGGMDAVKARSVLITLVPIRPRSRGERRFLRTSNPGVSLRPPLAAFIDRSTLRHLSTPLLTPFDATPRPATSTPPPQLEGGSPARVRAARALVDAGVAVMGHVGLTPQSISVLGGFRPQGRSHDEAADIVERALALQDAGCFSGAFCSISHWSPYDRVRVVNADP